MTVKKYYIKKGATEYELHSFEHKKKNTTTINTTDLSLSRTDNSVFDIGDNVSIGYHNESDVFVADFNGDITAKQVNQELVMAMESYDGRVYRTEYVTEVHENKTIEWIVDWLITTYTDLTYASTNTTGITLERFVINTETVGEVITRILKNLDWQTRTDNSENFYFEPSGDITSSVILQNGINAFLEGDWKKSPNRLTNSCTVVGDKAKFNTNETSNPSAAQTEITVAYKITGNVRVTVDGTEKIGGQSGSTGTFDYSIDSEQKKIIFESGMAGSETVIVYYEYELPIKITAINQDSISSYGRFPRKVTDDTLKTVADARKLAKKIVSVYGSPITSGEFKVSWDESIDVGETVQIIDSFNLIDSSFVVVGMAKKYPTGDRIISVGVEELMSLDMNKDINDRIKRLEADKDNSDILQKYLTFPERIDIKSTSGRKRTRTRNIGGDTMIYGNNTFGIWGTAKWSSTANNSFVLGNASAAILGASLLGSRTSSWEVASVTNYNSTMNERFNFTTYNNTNNTTATWNTTSELCTFTVGEIAESLAVYKGTAKTKATITVEDDTNLTAELSMDGGSNWESVTIGTSHIFTNSGSELRWRLTASGNAETKWVKIVYS